MSCWKGDLGKGAVALLLLVLTASCSGKKCSVERKDWGIALGFIEILQS